MNISAWMVWIDAHSDKILRASFLFLLLPLIVLATGFLRKSLQKHVSQQMAMLISKVLSYTLFLLVTLSLLKEFGIKLTPLLGAAGIVGIAVGFAAQTSLSNLISGIFLIMEHPFQVGDLVKADVYTGVIHSIDLLSVKLRTFDNTLIRIPNETMIKSPVTNITAFPIRRMDLIITTAYKENIEHVMQVLREEADKIPSILDEPEPFILFKDFGDSALEFQLGVWLTKEDYVKVRNTLLPAIKKRFDHEGIEIPFPHRTLYTGVQTEPFPIRLVQD